MLSGFPSGQSLASAYFSLLSDLDRDTKPDLIVRLSESLRQPGAQQKSDEDAAFFALAGKWNFDGPADRLIESIYSSRTKNADPALL